MHRSRRQVDSPALDKAAYDLAKEFLVRSGAVKGVTPELVGSYLHLDKTARPQTIAGLYERVLESAQSANMKAGVIGGSIGRCRQPPVGSVRLRAGAGAREV